MPACETFVNVTPVNVFPVVVSVGFTTTFDPVGVFATIGASVTKIVSFTGITTDGSIAGVSLTLIDSFTGIITDGSTVGTSLTVIDSFTGIITDGTTAEASVTLIVSLTVIKRFTVWLAALDVLDAKFVSPP